MIDRLEFKARRNTFAQHMENNSVAVFPAAKELTRSNDTEFPFRQDSDFYYLSAFPEPDAVIIIEKNDNGEVISSLICRPKDAFAEIWQGRRFGAEKAQSEFLFDNAYSITQLDEVLKDKVNGKRILYCSQGKYHDFDDVISGLLNTLRSAPKQGLKAPKLLSDARDIVHEMRLFKSEAEINVMRKAGEISCQAHIRAMKFAHVGATEYQIEAELHHHYAMNGARFPAYGTIAGGGENACILHYTENADELKNNDLLLVDSGCELQGYAADITRTYPINGKFTHEQKALYQLVLNAQYAALEFTKPGCTLKDAADKVNTVITQGLVDLGILTGEIEQLIADNEHKKYYMHGLGHWLGLDVHDVGNYKIDDTERPFEPGMVLTIEPGIYISESSDVDDKWKGIGIRIEDNILITESGFENLTISAPKTIEDIEAVMSA